MEEKLLLFRLRARIARHIGRTEGGTLGKDLGEDKEVSPENMFIVNLFLFPHNSFNDS